MSVVDIEPIRTEERQAADLTRRMRNLLDEVAILGAERRRIWLDLNKVHKVSQDRLAAQSGVTGQTVYMEIRKAREADG